MSKFEAEREQVVNRLIAEGILKTPSVIRSMKIVPREEFVPKDMVKCAYVDSPLPIGHGQTISAPHMCAIMNEVLRFEVGHKVLEVGAGSGYHAALVAEIVAPSNVDSKRWGHVYTVEIMPALAVSAQRSLEKAGYLNRVSVINADGSQGYQKEAPYDRIFVTAAAPDVPEPLIEQLRPGGILAIPVGGQYLYQELLLVEKSATGKTVTKSVCGVAFVLLRGEYGWK